MKEIRENLIRHIMSKGVRDRTIAETIAHDVLLDENSKGTEFKNANFRILNYFKVKKREEERYLPLESKDDSGGEDILIPYDDLNERKAAIQDNQLQLIAHLVDGTDERTTLIVQSYLTLDKPTMRGVAKHLGLDKKQVDRCLKRLARNYDKEKHGELSDYLYA